jgi:chorismate mutase
MAASKRIGTVKSRTGIPVMQPQRVREVLDDRSRIGARFGLDDKFVRKLFSLLVRESVRIQEEMLKNGASTRKPPSR